MTPAEPARSIVLVGLPGAGKSTVGRAVAERLGWPYVDLDAEVERAAGTTVAGIFARDGEAAFRAAERTATESLAGRRGLVIAPGGGWIENPGCVELLRPSASIVHLKVGVDTALRRMGAAQADRPLLRGPDPRAALAALLARRAPLYAGADVVIDTEVLDFQSVVRSVSTLAS